MKELSLWHQAEPFGKRLAEIKSGICPLGGPWYPFPTFASIGILDRMLEGDMTKLVDMIGADPALDLGCGDGDLAFFLESLGASAHAADYPTNNYNRMTGVEALKQALRSSVQVHVVDADQPLDLPVARFGLTMMLGVLYHLKNPYSALELLAKSSRYCFLSTRIAAFTPDKKTRLAEIPTAYLLEEGEIHGDPSNYWIFTETGLRRILKRTGWTVCHYSTIGNAERSDPVTDKGDARAFFVLRSRLVDPDNVILLTGWHEVEFGAWRWTKRRFSIAVQAPADPDSVMLRFRFNLPQPLFAQQSTLSLRAIVNGTALESQTYSEPGDHGYVRTVPAKALRSPTVQIDFELEPAFDLTLSDERELGVLVDFTSESAFVLN